jgi:hypothetical protein
MEREKQHRKTVKQKRTRINRSLASKILTVSQFHRQRNGKTEKPRKVPCETVNPQRSQRNQSLTSKILTVSQFL